MHVSLSFPSEWMVLGEAAALCLVLALIFRYPARAETLGERAWRFTSSLPHGRWSPVFYLVAGAVGAASVCLFLGLPVPRVTDELSYLLTADTFAHGRLSNPTPELSEHFVQQHVLTEPTRMGKYPPASALPLALGQVVAGHPVAGLWLQAGLLAVAVLWLVASFMQPPWPGLAALLVILRLGVGSYWHQSYWGGGMAAIGGCLVLGAVLRLAQQPRARDSFWLATGTVILANTRYYEGFLFALPCAVTLVFLCGYLKGERRRNLVLALLPGVAVLIVGAAMMAFFNRAVTGDPWQLPHLAYTRADLVGFGHFLWTHPDTRANWPSHALAQLLPRTAYVLQFLLGLPLTVVLIVFCGRLRDRRLIPVVATTAAVFLGLAITRSWWHHYAAPITGGVILLTMLCLDQLLRWRWREREIGPALVIAALMLATLSSLLQVRAFRADPEDWSYRRDQVQQQLSQTPGDHLVLVRYLDGSAIEWVSNPADLQKTRVLWAIEQDPDKTQALLRAFPGRTPWLLEVKGGWSTDGPVPLAEALPEQLPLD